MKTTTTPFEPANVTFSLAIPANMLMCTDCLPRPGSEAIEGKSESETFS
ncbi:MAG: hypothetical protein HWD62_05365 [Cyclobacteriaceae bacterium]|nr:MAG: hypothetical protein HWD62_05365 [Cyclobacteriaceae bacterium]